MMLVYYSPSLVLEVLTVLEQFNKEISELEALVESKVCRLNLPLGVTKIWMLINAIQIYREVSYPIFQMIWH